MKKVLSLFSGISGLCCYGIQEAGLEGHYEVAKFVEISPFAQSFLREHHPGVPTHPDITTYKPEENEYYDVITAGFPCTATSGAGHREGIEGRESNLWFEALRIIGELKPRWVLIENPIGLLHRGATTVLEGLNELRYDALWFCVSGEEVGLSHKRRRVFILANSDGVLGRQDWQQATWSDRVGAEIARTWLTKKDRKYQPGISVVALGVPIGIGKRVEGCFQARRAIGLSCSPRQAAIAWSLLHQLESEVL